MATRTDIGSLPSARLLHRLSAKSVRPPESLTDDEIVAYDTGSAQRFLERIPMDLPLRDASVVDLGCGYGVMACMLARLGARRVLGVDVQDVEGAKRIRDGRFSDVAERVELRQVRADVDRLEGEQFDLVVSKDTFEHVGDPAGYVTEMSRLAGSGGLVVIGFGPLWLSPFGGHIDFMTPVPWAHLLFREDVLMHERRRFRPDEDVERFEEIRGGLNRMTLARFEALMAASGLERLAYASNRSAGRLIKIMKLPSRLPVLREYFTSNVYGVWRRPSA